MQHAEFLSAEVEVERRFVPGPFGQIHIRIARPRTEVQLQRPIFLFPPTPHSGDYYKPLMMHLATDRIVVAVDTPGFGDSAAPSKLTDISDYARAANAATMEMEMEVGDRSFDLLGYHTGGLIACEVALTMQEKVNRIMLPGFPYFTPEARTKGLQEYSRPHPILFDGKHLLERWEYSKMPMEAGVSIERTQEHFNDMMQSFPESWRAYRAAFSYHTESRISEVRQPVLLLSVAGSLEAETRAASEIFPDAAHIHLEKFTFGIFDLGPEVIADHCRAFLDD